MPNFFFVVAPLAAAALLGCGSLEGPCGRSRSLLVDDTTSTLGLHLLLVDDEKRHDVITWEIDVFGVSQNVTAIHLHDAIVGHGDRMLFDLSTEEDQDPGPGFKAVGGGDYSYDASITSLFDLIRSGDTYIDVHTGGQPEAGIRQDIIAVQFEDWSDYFCS